MIADGCLPCHQAERLPSAYEMALQREMAEHEARWRSGACLLLQMTCLLSPIGHDSSLLSCLEDTPRQCSALPVSRISTFCVYLLHDPCICGICSFTLLRFWM